MGTGEHGQGEVSALWDGACAGDTVGIGTRSCRDEDEAGCRERARKSTGWDRDDGIGAMGTWRGI